MNPNPTPPQGKIHTLKTWPPYFAAVRDGVKTFEIRNTDRCFEVGDVLVLQEFDPMKDSYTGEMVSCRITYMTDWGQPKGQAVLGITRLAQPEPATEQTRPGKCRLCGASIVAYFDFCGDCVNAERAKVEAKATEQTAEQRVAEPVVIAGTATQHILELTQRIAELEREIEFCRNNSQNFDVVRDVHKERDRLAEELKQSALVVQTVANLTRIRSFNAQDLSHEIIELVTKSEAERDCLAKENARLKEQAAVLQSQVDNADVNLEQVRMIWKTRAEKAESQLAEAQRDGERLKTLAAHWTDIRLTSPDMSNKNWKADIYSMTEPRKQVRFLTLIEAIDAIAESAAAMQPLPEPPKQ